MRWKTTLGFVTSVLLSLRLTAAARADDWSQFIEKPGTTYVATSKPTPATKTAAPATKTPTTKTPATKTPATKKPTTSKAKVAQAKPRAKTTRH
jgi:hypothetical protein